jgi:hypothetical protein
VAEFTGSRRTSQPLAAAPLSAAQAQNAFAEDDAMLTCPECGAGVRPDQKWCTLCLHVLSAPEPPPVPVVPEPTDAVVAAPALVFPAEPTPLPAELEATADALLAQLAVESRKERLAVPTFLDSKAKVALAVTVGMSVFSAVVLVGLSLVGAVLR